MGENNMLKKVLIGLLLLSGSLMAQEFPPLTAEQIYAECEDCDVSQKWDMLTLDHRTFNYVYVTTNIPAWFPALGFGFRLIDNKNSVDISIEGTTVFIASRYQSAIKYLRYFGDNYYAGAGVSFGGTFRDGYYPRYYIFPIISIGKEVGMNIHEISIGNLGIGYKYGWKF
jgi:hypothetical protein